MSPSMRYQYRSGLPGLPRRMEAELRELSDLSPTMLTQEELERLDAWLEARVAPIRRAKAIAGESHQLTRKLLGWAVGGERV
jgi:hypothetical protein